MSLRPRIVVASPDRSEVARLADWLLAEGLDPVPVGSLPGAIQEVQSRPFDVLIADARFAFQGHLHATARTHNARAPLVVLGGIETSVTAERVGTFHLERPVDQTLFLCHVAMAIVEGRPARRSVRKRIMPIDAEIDGKEVAIIDVSDEGMRIELRRGKVAPPPHFRVRIPLIGVALSVRRAWIASGPADNVTASWCGVELFQPHPRAIQVWRTFVDALPSA
jgi:hypothetical protein